jgi:hypothetical protein
MVKSFLTLGTAAVLGAVTLTTAPNPAAAQAFLVPAVVGAFLGAAATSHYYGNGPYGYYGGGPYGYYGGYYPAGYGWGQSCGWGQCSGWGRPCGWQSCGGWGGNQPVVIIVR